MQMQHNAHANLVKDKLTNPTVGSLACAKANIQYTARQHLGLWPTFQLRSLCRAPMMPRSPCTVRTRGRTRACVTCQTQTVVFSIGACGEDATICRTGDACVASLSRLVLELTRDAVITGVGRLSRLILELSSDAVITRRLSRLVLELSSDTTDLIHGISD